MRWGHLYGLGSIASGGNLAVSVRDGGTIAVAGGRNIAPGIGVSDA